LDDITATAKNAWNGTVTSNIPNRTSGAIARGAGSMPIRT
jgi:hypothetical protein